jgi:hypothetical protein
MTSLPSCPAGTRSLRGLSNPPLLHPPPPQLYWNIYAASDESSDTAVCWKALTGMNTYEASKHYSKNPADAVGVLTARGMNIRKGRRNLSLFVQAGSDVLRALWYSGKDGRCLNLTLLPLSNLDFGAFRTMLLLKTFPRSVHMKRLVNRLTNLRKFCISKFTWNSFQLQWKSDNIGHCTRTDLS